MADGLTCDRCGKNLLKKIEGLSEEEMMDSVYRRMTGDLCPPCQKKYLMNPFGKS